MPEGDTIHKLALVLARHLEGQLLTSAEVRDQPSILLAGHRVKRVRATGKHLFIDFDNAITLRSHLGMNGSWHGYAHGEAWKKPPRHAGIVLHTQERVLVCFHPKEVQIGPTKGLAERALTSHLGPDLLGDEFLPEHAVVRVRQLLEPATPILDALLDQRPACGIGNVYKSELLFLERLAPTTPVAVVNDERLAELYLHARQLLAKNLGIGQRRTRFSNDALGPLWVYGRRGFPCLRCGTKINGRKLGKDLRSTYWCPRCQPRF
ncbi:MAG: Fpg/Nei family DNA glycosylase [Chromatiales bacterium]|nr:Fpg/Nei family DNA glycosylase [Chromatiales bacterium]